MFFRTAAATGPRRFPQSIRIVVFLSLVASGAPSSIAQSSAPGVQGEQSNVVRGTVVNSVTHAPIGRALVHSPDNRFATFTDSEGHFEFAVPQAPNEGEVSAVSGLPRQMWRTGLGGVPLFFMARKPGFLDDPNSDRPSDLSPDGEVTISLIPEGLIKGRVSLSGSDGAVGVTVQLYSRQVQEGMPRWVRGTAVRANSSGEFRFSELLPGAYKLLTHELMDNDPVITPPGGQLYGFAPVFYPGVTDFASAGTIQLAAGQTVEADLSLTRQPYYPVKVPVATGENVGGINVDVSVQGHRGPGYSLGYNAGTQMIEGILPNGNYLVEASRYGQESGFGSVNLKVTGAAAEAPTLTLTGSGSISVDVKESFSETNATGTGSWSDGQRTVTLHGPRAYLQVLAESADDFEQRRMAALRPPAGPKDESLVLENLAPGRYWLRLSTGRGYIASATMGGADLLHEPLVVGAGASTPIEIKLRDDFATIEGTVTGVAGQSVGSPASGYSPPPAWVYLVPLPDSPGQFQQVAVSEDGKFVEAAMAPGSYRVLAFKSRQQNLPFRDPEAMKAYETKGQVIQLAAGQKTAVQVQMIPGSE
jgi:hypothetical protein